MEPQAEVAGSSLLPLHNACFNDKILRCQCDYSDLGLVNFQELCYFNTVKVVKLKYSKSQIDKAGEALKTDSLNEEVNQSLEVLSNWRAYHAMPLDTFAKVLRERVSRISDLEDTIVAQRLKRTPSILLKLKKHKTMRLSTMQDIRGLRAVFKDIKSGLS